MPAALVSGPVLQPPAGAAAGPAGSSALQAEVFSIAEQRGTQNRCDLTFKFTGEVLADKMAILGVRVRRAVDDTGVDLALKDGWSVGGAGVAGGFMLAALHGWHELRPTKTRHGTARIAAAGRRAQTIVELEGEVELFSPTLENGGVVVIEEVTREPGRALQTATMEQLGIRLSCLTKELYEAGKAAARAGAAPPRPWTTPADSQADVLFPGILGEPANAPRCYLVFQLEDPQQRVAGLAFREPAGRLLPVTHRKGAHGLIGFYFDRPVPEKLAALIYLAVPEALQKAPFTIRNIALP